MYWISSHYILNQTVEWIKLKIQTFNGKAIESQYTNKYGQLFWKIM